MNNIDSRGIERGKCSRDDCDCEQYERSEKHEFECAYCEHSPAKHAKLRGGGMKLPNPCASIPKDTPDQGNIGASGQQKDEVTLAQKIQMTCTTIDGFIHILPRKEVNVDPTNRLAKFEFGAPGPGSVPGKVLMLVGATGAGKSTLINGMINYLYGVKWDDPFRFKLIVDEAGEMTQAHSQTKWITAYVLHNEEGFALPYTLTLIDTPGFGDTEGIKADDELRIQIREFFSHGGNIGVDQLDGICFVVQSSLARLTHTQKYIFGSILAVFGKDVEKIIYVLITFSDDEPDAKDMNSFFWNMGMSSFERFFKGFRHTEPVSLTLTQYVLKQRKHLEVALQGILPQIKTASSRTERMRETYAALKQHESEADANKNFTYKVKVTKQRKVDLEVGTYVTNCTVCSFTCHYPCPNPGDWKKFCAAMTGGFLSLIGITSSVCKVCPNKCEWDKHHNNSYRFETYEVEEEQTYENLKKTYEEAHKQKMDTKRILDQLIKDFNKERTNVLKLIREAHECLHKLDEIALKPDPLGMTQYIDLLVESEKREGKPGFEQRITYLLDAKEKAKLAENLDENYDPFKECMEDFSQLGIDMSHFDSKNSKSWAFRAFQKAKERTLAVRLFGEKR
ncbi:unnamed protein product [Darwinula stevensoni]|uniref:Septin-type G domain-containing protein n=1 Tax=Darwinula stevensoni TaxID=69355 RepID=A0A7R9FR53_9CRUS|nr:unnamed protein product [Darwinula stevensoni]CAG0901006.1 unnamed protein product [Darwinula stevensoni]